MKDTARWTGIGGAVGGGLFFALSVYRSIASGGPSWSHLNPIGVMAVIGATVGGGLFLALSVYRSIASGGPSWSHLNPIGVMTVIGATVGALVGPLIGTIAARRRSLPDETTREST